MGPHKWSSLGNGSIDRDTTRFQKRGSGRERTTENSRTRIGGNYSSNRRRGIQNIAPKNKTTY
jgi:hypothetical protein